MPLDKQINELPEITSLPDNYFIPVDDGAGNYFKIRGSNLAVSGGDTTAPTVSSKTATAATTVVVVFSESVTVTTAGWSFKKNGSAWAISSVAGSGTTWTFTMGSSAISTDTLLVSYNSSTGATVDGASNELVTFTDAAVTNSIAGFDSDASAFFTAAGITDTTQKNAVNQLVLDLKAASIWTKMDAIYPMVGGTSTTHRYNLKNTANFLITFSGTLTHNATGVTPDGSTGYGNTGLTPSTISGQYTLNSAHMSYFSGTNAAQNSALMGVSKTDNTLSMALVPKWSDNNNYSPFNSSAASNSADYSTTAGLITSSRSSGGIDYYLGATNVQAFTFSTGVFGLPNQPIILFANNPSSGVVDLFTTRVCKFASIGGGLTGSEVAALNTAVNAYNTTLGR